MDFNTFVQSKKFKIILIVIAEIILVFGSFKAGLLVGFKKANFSYRWGQNYHRNFAGPRHGFFNDMMDRDFIDGHGLFGQIIKIDGQTVIIKDRDGVEKIVLITDKTSLKQFHGNAALTDFKVNDYIVVIGQPNQSGQIEAQFIRLLPAPQGSMMKGRS